MPNWPSTWREERDISKDNDAVAIRREAAVHLRRGFSQPGALQAFKTVISLGGEGARHHEEMQQRQGRHARQEAPP